MHFWSFLAKYCHLLHILSNAWPKTNVNKVPRLVFCYVGNKTYDFSSKKRSFCPKTTQFAIRANDPPKGPASSKRSPGGTSLLKMIIQRAGTGLFLWKISFGTHMFIISGQTHNQKKNNEKLTVRWGSTLSVSHKAIKYLCLFITPLREPVENYSTDFFR